MLKLLTTLHLNDPASLKRALTTAISVVVLLTINPILSTWNIPPVSTGAIASVAGVILQSGLKSGAIAVASLSGAPTATVVAPTITSKR